MSDRERLNHKHIAARVMLGSDDQCPVQVGPYRCVLEVKHQRECESISGTGRVVPMNVWPLNMPTEESS